MTVSATCYKPEQILIMLMMTIKVTIKQENSERRSRNGTREVNGNQQGDINKKC